ncbi:MAG TPA: hypothetical protein VGE60_06195 [Telluria sp.]
MQGNLEFGQHKPQRRLAIGIAASLAAHMLLVIAFRADALRDPGPDLRERAQSLIVFVRPKPLPPEPEPEPEPVAKPAGRVRPASPSAVREPEAVEPVADVPAAVIATDTPKPEQDPFYVQPAPKDKPFDMAAARLAAREIATSPDPARADLPVGQFDKERNRVKPQDPVAREIARAKRRDCKDGIPGGLLAPLLLLMDKKDHGCKW